jgi:hypothetical protein
MSELKAAQNAYIEHVRKAVKGKPRDGSVNLRELSEDPQALARIRELQQQCQQFADEKVQVANRVYEMVEVHVSKLGVYSLGMRGATFAFNSMSSPFFSARFRRRPREL